MSTTRIISEADIISNRAAGYRLDKGQLKNQERVSPSANSTADGSLYFRGIASPRRSRTSLRSAKLAEPLMRDNLARERDRG
jgi:hypothetical protein